MMALKTLIFLLLWATLGCARSTVTITSAISACASSAPFVTVYNTTNSAGATILISSTVTPLLSVSKYTITNSDGSTIVTSTTLQPSSAAGSSVSGTSATGSSSMAASGTFASEAPGASPSAPCPQAAFAQNFVSASGADWQIFCSADAYYYSLPSLTTATFEQCINACDAYQPSGSYGNYPCVAITWTTPSGDNTSNCLLKYGVDQVVYGTPNYCSAKLASYVLPPNFPVSLVSTYSSTQTGSTSATATATYSYATGTQVTSYQAPSPCPYTNQSTYSVPDGKGVSYEILCGISLEYNDLPDINVGSFEDCMAACNDYVPAAPGEPYDQPCVAVTYIGENGQLSSCFRHYAVGHYFTVGGSPYGDSAVRHNPANRKKREIQDHESVPLLVKRLDNSRIHVEEFLQARDRLAEQGISLVLSS